LGGPRGARWASQPGRMKRGEADLIRGVDGQHLTLQIAGQLRDLQAEGGQLPPVILAIAARGSRLAEVDDAPVPRRDLDTLVTHPSKPLAEARETAEGFLVPQELGQ